MLRNSKHDARPIAPHDSDTDSQTSQDELAFIETKADGDTIELHLYPKSEVEKLRRQVARLSAENLALERTCLEQSERALKQEDDYSELLEERNEALTALNQQDRISDSYLLEIEKLATERTELEKLYLQELKHREKSENEKHLLINEVNHLSKEKAKTMDLANKALHSLEGTLYAWVHHASHLAPQVVALEQLLMARNKQVATLQVELDKKRQTSIANTSKLTHSFIHQMQKLARTDLTKDPLDVEVQVPKKPAATVEEKVEATSPRMSR